MYGTTRNGYGRRHPVIAKAVEEKRVDVVSAVYELATGQVRLLK